MVTSTSRMAQVSIALPVKLLTKMSVGTNSSIVFPNLFIMLADRMFTIAPLSTIILGTGSAITVLTNISSKPSIFTMVCTLLLVSISSPSLDLLADSTPTLLAIGSSFLWLT
ncbi:hypothetical protein ACH5RR_041155 [Cinchona calisaya]|uniref:Uncharacterized protein n=1 Tax=Cinchona calisaya TaxID=153742 RepID=A0ABD2XY71_9GENT